MRKPDSPSVRAIPRGDLAEYALAEPENLGAQSSWDRPADAETQRPINGQDRSMKPGKPIFTEKKVKPTPFKGSISR
jgi:hypothetical protein